MEISQFFFTLFCMVVFSLGLDKIMEQGNILYFLRKPFEGLFDELNSKKELYESLKNHRRSESLIELEHKITDLKIKYYIAKPLVLCITCFASIWGASVFISLNGINEALLPYLIISCVSSAFIQTAIYVKASI